MKDTSIDILEILKHYFKLGLKDTEAADRIQEMEGNETISECMAQNRFELFVVGDLYLEINPRSGRPSVVNYNDSKHTVVEKKPTASTQELSEELGPSKDAIYRVLQLNQKKS